jgi:putative peptidoglycan lipid II flippase
VGSGAVALLGYSQVLSMLPVSLFGMAVSAAELPAMAGETGSPDAVATALRTRLNRGLDRIAYFVVPTIVAFVLVGELVVYGLFGGGAFTAETARWVHRTLIGAALGLLANTAGRLYASACYALGDAQTPFRGAVLRVGLGGVLGWIGALGLPTWLGVDARWGLQALTVAAGLAAWVEYHWLRARVTRTIGSTAVPTRRLLGYWAVAAVSVLGGLLASIGIALLTRRAGMGAPGWGYAAVTAAVAAGAYVALTARFGIDDARRA